MLSVYIDESGYTGTDLLNHTQPFQGASAISISESEANDLINKYFPTIKSHELKYRNLARRTNNWNNLLNLQKDLLENFICITSVCNKKYLLILQFLDYAAEPFYHDQGVNFYKDGCNYSLASLLYFTGDTLLEGKNFSEVLSLFQYAINSKSDVSITALIEKIKNINWRNLPEAFGPLALETPSCISAIKNKFVSSDGAYGILISLISSLEKVINNNYIIVHDKSKNLEKYNVTLDKMINHKREISFKTTELTSIKFPLKLSAVSQIDSKDSVGVQLADVLIGGIMDSSKAITDVKINEYNKEIIHLYKDHQLIHLLPNLNFHQQKEFSRNSQANEAINYFSEHFS